MGTEELNGWLRADFLLHKQETNFWQGWERGVGGWSIGVRLEDSHHFSSIYSEEKNE